MAMPRPADLASDLLDDFRLDMAEQLPRCEQLLIELEHQPEDTARLRALFRQVHTLKGNLGIVGFQRLMPLPQALEDILSALREGRMRFDSVLGDILLLSLDHFREQLAEALDSAPARLGNNARNALSQALRALAAAPGARQAEIRQTLLHHLDPATRLEPAAIAAPNDIQQLLGRHGIPVDADLLLFTELMQASEQRSHYWQGRGLRLLSLALGMNAMAGNPINPAQLATAVCLHDFGMAFLPLDILHKDQHLTREERKQMQAHPRLAFDLLKRMPAWDEAGEIILQHQEHADGSGYPKGLSEREIHPGALILNIVDTFDARTHERAHQTLSKRPRLRAILEINNLAGTQFSAHWVEQFNRLLQQRPQLAHL